MLKNPKKADLDKDGKLSSYEKRRGMAIEKNMKVKKANVGMAAERVRNKEKAREKEIKKKRNLQVSDASIKASMGKSVRGYGAARTSGMGLQDESLPPGKSLDYYKDLM
jgi:phosphopantothenoylcysteine synthetase/decarboxylase